MGQGIIVIKFLDLREFKGRVFFTTDIHGHFDLLVEKMRDVGFCGDRDLLILGGDSIDRGPCSEYVLDFIDNEWVHSVRGNHEQLFIESYEEDFNEHTNVVRVFFQNGGEWVKQVHPDQLFEIYQKLKFLPLAIEIITPSEKIGVVHAECPFNDWDEFIKLDEESMYFQSGNIQWARTRYYYAISTPVSGIDRLMVGHNPTDSGEIEVLGNVHYCDLGSFFRNKISFVQLM